MKIFDLAPLSDDFTDYDGYRKFVDNLTRVLNESEFVLIVEGENIVGLAVSKAELKGAVADATIRILKDKP